MDENSPGSVTVYLGELKAGEGSTAAQELWNRYFSRLAALARARLSGSSRREADEEDVALSALNSLFLGLKHGRFPDLTDRTSLWPLLVTLTARKAINQVRRQRAQKRSPAKEQALAGLDALVSTDPTPEFAAEVAEQTDRLLSALTNPMLKIVAKYKLEGYTNDEIAGCLGVSKRTIVRKLNLIRSLWHQEPDE